MSELKFRAWDEKRKKMWSAEELGRDEITLNPDGRGFVNVSSVSTRLSQYLPHLIPLLYTGYKDLWEGDIVRLPWTCVDDFEKEFTYLAVIKQKDYGFQCVPVHKKGREPRPIWLNCAEGNLLDGEEIEKVGNSYENPELLESKSSS